MSRSFRFAVVATPQGSAQEWTSLARRVADLGYATLLMPDGLQLLSPFTSLAMAATAAPLRVGTFVLAAPLRPPRAAAWEARRWRPVHSLLASRSRQWRPTYAHVPAIGRTRSSWR